MTNKKNKAFVILTPGFPASEEDSTCLPMQQDLVKALRQFPDLEIIILSFQYPYHADSYRWFDTAVFSFNGRNKGGLRRLLLRKKVGKVLNRINREYTIVGLLSFWLNECALVGKRFGARHHLPHYCWMLGQDAKKENKYIRRMDVRDHELIALSDFLQDEFERNFQIRPFAVIPPGISALEYCLQDRPIDLLAVGSLIPLKQFDLLIEVVAELRSHFPSLKAVLIGDGPEKPNIERRIAECGLYSHITLAGTLSHDDVLGYMKKTKILVHPSAYEGFGMVCLEALGAGANVVSFCRPMNVAIEQWHVVRSIQEMTARIHHLLQGAILHKPVSPYSIRDTADAFMKLYHIPR